MSENGDERFRNNWETLDNQQGLVGPLEDEIRNDRRKTISYLALLFPDASRAIIGRIVHDHLDFRKVCARWVPLVLTERLKRSEWDLLRNFCCATQKMEMSSLILCKRLWNMDYVLHARGENKLRNAVIQWLNGLAAEYNEGILKMVNRYDTYLNFLWRLCRTVM